MSLRLQMAQAAQGVYDEWQEGEEGFEDIYAGGGICHLIAEAIIDVIGEHIPDVEAGTAQPSCGENHVWALFALGNEGYVVDVPYYVYETGGGYTWEKIPDVEFSAEDVTIDFVNPDDVRATLEEGV